MKALRSILFVSTILLLINCKSDDDSTPIPLPNFSENFYGLWEYGLQNEDSNALFFDENGTVYKIHYGDLNILHVSPVFDGDQYSFEENIINHYTLGLQPITYDGGNRIDIDGNTLVKTVSAQHINEIINVITPEEFNFTTNQIPDSGKDIEQFGSSVMVLNANEPGVGERYGFFDLDYLDSRGGFPENGISFSLSDNSNIISMLSEDEFRYYSNSFPDISPVPVVHPFINNMNYQYHSIVKPNDLDILAYAQNLGEFHYLDISPATLNPIDTYSVLNFEFPNNLYITSLHIDRGATVTLTDGYNIHFFYLTSISSGDPNDVRLVYLDSYSLIDYLSPIEGTQKFIKSALYNINIEGDRLFLLLSQNNASEDELLVIKDLNIVD